MKNIKLIILSTLIIFIAACEKEDIIKTIDLGTEFFISSGYTTLDNEATFEIENQPKNLSSVRVTAMGGVEADGETEITAPTEDLGDISISSGAGMKTYTDAQLGTNGQGIGASFDFSFKSSYNGRSITRYYTLHVDNAISMDLPETLEENVKDTLTYEVAPASASVTDVMLQMKVGVLSDYEDMPGDWGEEGEIIVDAADYSIGDTLYYKIMASSSIGKDAMDEYSLPIVEPEEE